MNRKKILFFTAGYVGGAERMTVNIAKMLPPDKFDVSMVVMGSSFSITEFIPSSIRIKKLPFRKFNFLLFRILHLILQEKPDVVFASSVAVSPRVIIASRLAKTKVITRSSGMVGYYNRSDYLKVRCTYPLATLLIAQQEDMRQEMSKTLRIPLRKIVTLNNPIDTAEIEKKRNAPSPFHDDTYPNFVNVARISPAKGHDIAIKAFFEVIKQKPSAHLYFVGKYDNADSYYQSLLALIEKLCLQDCVHFVGYDPNPYRWMAHADCFVFPSRREGLPNALIEASYIGVPCVATRCLNIIGDIIHDGYNGHTAEVDDVPAVAQGMVQALELQNYQMLYHSAHKEDFVRLFEHACER